MERTELEESSSSLEPSPHSLPHYRIGALGPQVGNSIILMLDIPFRDWDFESQNTEFAEKNFYLERWKKVKEIFRAIF